MSQAHQLGAIRARVFKSLLSLIRGIRSLKRCQKALQILEHLKSPRDWERTKRRCRQRFTNWDYLLSDFFCGLKTMVPPRVRNEMWEIAEVKALDGIVFSLTSSDRVWPLYPELRRHVEEKRPPADFRLSTKAGIAFGTDQIRYYLPTLLLNPALTPEWPDVAAAIDRIENYFKTCEEIAKNDPEDFRLTPSSLDAAVAEMRTILAPREIHSRKRVESKHPEPGIKREIALAAHDHYLKNHPGFGGTFEEIELELRDRWPEMPTELTKATVLESFRRGLIRVFGGDIAHQQGFAPPGGEFNDDAQLDRWLSSAMGDDGEKLILRLKSASAEENVNVEAKPISPSALADILKMSVGTLNSYSKSAGVATPLRGKRDFRYSYGDATKIATRIADHSCTKTHRDAAQHWLDNQKQIAK